MKDDGENCGILMFAMYVITMCFCLFLYVLFLVFNPKMV